MVMELLRKMLEVTMTRGAQSAGLVTYRQDGGDAQGCRARTVSGKRTDLARLVLSKFSRVIERRRPKARARTGVTSERSDDGTSVGGNTSRERHGLVI